jgi:hypothetical protein
MSDFLISTNLVESKIQKPPRASTSVFAIPELLECIFHQLPLGEILRVQRICRQWRDIITDLPSLQEALFFRPKTDRLHEPEFNPLLQSLFPPLFDMTAVNYSSMHEEDEIKALPWYKDLNRRSSVLMEDASWRKMYPVQPPAKIDEIVLNASCGCDSVDDSLIIAKNHQHEQEDGAKMGLLFDALVAILDAYDYTGFFIIWGMFPVLKANGQTDDDGHKWLTDRKQHGKEHTGLGNFITMYETHNEECFAIPYTYEIHATGLRIREFQGQQKHSIANGRNADLPSFLE